MTRASAGPRRWLAGVTAAVAAGAAMVGFVPGLQAAAVPARGNSGWSVLLCKFRGEGAEPQPPSFFGRFFGAAGAGTDNLYDYFSDQSYGKLKINASVGGWYQMPYTLAQEAPKSRGTKINDCVTTATSAGYSVPTGNRVAVITNAPQDSGSAGGKVLLDPLAWNVRFAAHEMGHGYGLGHSFSNDLSYQNAPWSAPGEYDDPWDEMSAQHVYGFETDRHGNGGVGLNAYGRDKLGFLSGDRVRTVGADDATSTTITLAALQSPNTSGVLLARVPFDPADAFHYYTVEYQRRTGWSRGIPADTVLIHEVQNGRPTLIRDLGAAGKPPAQQLSTNGVTIRVGTLNGNQATVRITSDIATRCVQGYVWREARPGDVVCVLGSTRAQVRADNAVKESRWVDGPYGPHTCIQGYVWREAFAGDDVCVTGDQRTQAAADNAAANSRRNPARQVWGPNTCRSGYVWREADPADFVCVTGATRAQVRADNAVRASRWVNGPYGPHTCIQGYVWREAYIGDDACVTGATRTQARYDNTQVADRVQRVSG